jgi:hypothetical protein
MDPQAVKEGKICEPRCFVHEIFWIQSKTIENCSCSKQSRVVEEVSNDKFYELISSV